MKNHHLLSTTLALSAVCLLAGLSGCNRDNGAASGNADATTNNVPPPPPPTTPPPTTDTATTPPSTTASDVTPPSGAPRPDLSSKNDTNTSPASGTVTAPASENSRTDTNAAPAGPAGSAPSQDSKSQ